MRIDEKTATSLLAGISADMDTTCTILGDISFIVNPFMERTHWHTSSSMEWFMSIKHRHKGY